MNVTSDVAKVLAADHAAAQEQVRARGTAEDYLKLGSAAAAIGDVQGAEAAFARSLQLEPRQWQAQFNLAELYFSAGLVGQARLRYALAVERGPDRFETWNGLGLVTLFGGGEPRHAIRCFVRALAAVPGRPEPLYNLALVLSQLGMKRAARQFAELSSRSPIAGDSLKGEAKRLADALEPPKVPLPRAIAP